MWWMHMMSITINQSINLSLSLYSINCFSRTRTYRFSPCMRSCQGEFPSFLLLLLFWCFFWFFFFHFSIRFFFCHAISSPDFFTRLGTSVKSWDFSRPWKSLHSQLFFFDNSFFFSLDKIFLFNFLAMNDIKFSALFPSILENFILFFSCFSLLFFPRSCCLFGFFDYLFDFVFFSLYRDWFFCSLAIQC